MLTLIIVLLFVGRVLFGGFFVLSGWNHLRHLTGTTGYAASKGVPFPDVAVIVTGLMLIFGGVGIILGFLVPYALTVLGVFLLITTFKMHQFWKVADPMQKMGEEINFKKNMALLGAVL